MKSNRNEMSGAKKMRGEDRLYRMCHMCGCAETSVCGALPGSGEIGGRPWILTKRERRKAGEAIGTLSCRRTNIGVRKREKNRRAWESKFQSSLRQNIRTDRGEKSHPVLRQSHSQSCVQTVNAENVTKRSQAGTFSSVTASFQPPLKLLSKNRGCQIIATTQPTLLVTLTASYVENTHTHTTGDSGQRLFSQRQADKSQPRVLQLKRRRRSLLSNKGPVKSSHNSTK